MPITSGISIDEEKKHIAMKYLYPKQLENHGLTKTKLKISEAWFAVVNC